MRALTVVPGTAGTAQLSELPDPNAGDGELLVQGVAVGVCGTDHEIAAGEYGWVPPGRDRLVLGHESLGRVLDAPEGPDFTAGDLVVGVVRRPDPVPCAHGAFDMCRNGRYTERGIKELDGYAAQLWTVETDYAVRVDPALAEAGVLMEPTTVVAKAWDQIERIGGRSWFAPERVLVTGAGFIGLLGVQRDLEVHVLDQVREGPKPGLVEDVGAAYHRDGFDAAVGRAPPDILVEATGVASLVLDAMSGTRAYGLTCLTGVSPVGRRIELDAGALNRSIVPENDAVFGSVNANLDHYRQAGEALHRADNDWLGRLITRRIPLSSFADALTPSPEDIKVVLTLDD